tara:strand:- start:16 stop:285 length:270 start_codon:yes stop_codon:yes gene_type:complete
MKHYKNSDNVIYAYEPDGSQDHLIPDDYIAITDEEADAIRLYVKTYADLREENYPSIGDQLDMQYHDQLDGTTTWKDAITKVKSDNPKE